MRFTLTRGNEGGKKALTITGLVIFALLLVLGVVFMLKRFAIVATIMFLMAIVAFIVSAFEFDNDQTVVPTQSASGGQKL